jgi:hypothetical protein
VTDVTNDGFTNNGGTVLPVDVIGDNGDAIVVVVTKLLIVAGGC